MLESDNGLDKEYVLTGTTEQLISTIKRTFKTREEDDDFEDNLARFIIELSIRDRINEFPQYTDDCGGDNSVDSWYEQTADPATALIQVNKVPVSIVLSDLKVEMAKNLFVGFGPYIALYYIKGTPGDIVSVGTTLVFQFIVALWQVSTPLDKKYTCVCQKIASVIHKNNRDWFTLGDILPKETDYNGYYYCDQMDRIKTCDERHKELCRVNGDEFSKRIKYLEDKKVLIKEQDDRWRLRR